MITIKQAARMVGVTEATLRTWEKRYGVVAPQRTEAGYRLYDPPSIAALTVMRRMVAAGWSPSNAAAAILNGEMQVDLVPPGIPETASDSATPAAYTEQFLGAAARFDMRGIEESLDKGMSIGSFEHVLDDWLMPTLVALGEGWQRGEIDIAGEHLASHHVLRRLSAAFEAAGTPARGPRVVVGLPENSRHELGALAFATVLRRLGHNVMYLGADVPAASWDAAVREHHASAAVLGVVTAADQPPARLTTRTLMARHGELLVAVGGAFGTSIGSGVHELPRPLRAAAQELDDLLQADSMG